MTVKELSQFYYLGKEIKENKKQIKELEADLKKISKTVDSTQGSQLQIPFQLHSVKIEGIALQDKNRWHRIKAELEDVKKIVDLKLEQQVCEYNRISRFILSIDDSLMRQILVLRFVKCCAWNKIADEVGGNNTEASVKMMCIRFLKKL